MARSTPDRPRASNSKGPGQRGGGSRPAGSKGASSPAKGKGGGLHYYGVGKGGCIGIGLLVLLTLLIVGIAVGVVLGIFLIGD